MAEVKGVSVSATTVQSLKAEIKSLKDEISKLILVNANYEQQAKDLTDKQLQLSKATEVTKGAVIGVTKSYARLVAETNNLRKQWRSVEIGTAEFERLSEAINTNNNRLKEMDKKIGDNFRNVGNYAGAIRPLQFQLQQIVRELPSLTMSANQFFLAISNNLPMFADEIAKLRDANKELASQGKPTTNILKAIGGGMISWQTALVAVITLLTQFGGKIIEWVKTLGKAKVSIDDLAKSINNFATSISSERLELQAMFNALKNAEKGTTEYAIAKKAIQDKYGSYLENQSIEIKNLTDLASAYKVLEGRITATAIAKAMESERTEAIKQYQKTVNDILTDQNILKQAINMFGEEYGVELFNRIRLGFSSGVPEMQKEAEELLKGMQIKYNADTDTYSKRVYYTALDGTKLSGLTRFTYDADDALRSLLHTTGRYQATLTSIDAIAKQMGNLLGVKPEDVEEIKQVEQVTIDVTNAITKATENTEFARQVAWETKQTLQELKNEYKETQNTLTEFADTYLQQEKEKYNALQQNINAVKAQEQESTRYAQLESDNATKIHNIKQQALFEEKALLQQGLDDYIFTGDERIKVAERIAQIEKDIVFNTTQYETQQRKKSTQQAVQLATAGMQAMSSIFGSIADIYESESEQSEKSLKKAKNLKIAGATMDMLGGIVTAISGAFTNKFSIADWILAGIQAATILATGIANITKIKNTDTSGNSSSSSASGAIVSAPAVVQQVPVTRTLTGVQEEEQLNKSQRVYVVYDDIAKAGRKVDVTETESTF